MISGSPSNSSISKFFRSKSKRGEEWDRLAERHALPLEPGHREGQLLERAPQLVEKPGLADPRVAGHEHDLPAPGRCLAEAVDKQRQLALAPHERGQAPVPADLDAGAGAPRALHLEGPHGFVPFHGEQAQVARLEEALDRLVGVLGHDHRARPGGLLHAGGQVGGVAHRGVVHAQVVSDAPHHDGTRIEPDAHGYREPALGPQLAAVLGERALDAECRVHGAARAVLVRDGRPEERHDAVPRVLVDGPLEAVDLGGDELEAGVDDAMDLFRVQLLGQTREAGHVGEEDRHLAALTLQGRARLEDLLGEMLGGVTRRDDGSRGRAGRRLAHAGTARPTEARLRSERPPAGAALHGQRRPALVAEAAARRITGLTARTLHAVPGGLVDQVELQENGAKWPLTLPEVSSQLIPKACMWPRDALARARRLAAGWPTLSR
jgi:hypothetical protein